MPVNKYFIVDGQTLGAAIVFSYSFTQLLRTAVKVMCTVLYSSNSLCTVQNSIRSLGNRNRKSQILNLLSSRSEINFALPIFTSTERTDKKAKLLGKTYNLFEKIFKNRETIIFFCNIGIL